MAKAQSGLEGLTWGDFGLDTGLDVGDNNEIASINFVDLLNATYTLLPDTLFFNFLIPSAVSGYNMQIYALFSEDGVKSPMNATDTGERRAIIIATLFGAQTTGVQSNMYSVPVLARYVALNYYNNNSGGIVTVDTRFAPSFQGSYTP